MFWIKIVYGYSYSSNFAVCIGLIIDKSTVFLVMSFFGNISNSHFELDRTYIYISCSLKRSIDKLSFKKCSFEIILVNDFYPVPLKYTFYNHIGYPSRF